MPRHIGCSSISIVVVSLCLGCDSTPFLPPAPPELRPSSSELSSGNAQPVAATKTSPALRTPPHRTAEVAIKGIELILARPMTLERSKLEYVLRSNAGRHKLVFRLEAPKTGDVMTPEQMVRVIKQATEHNFAIVIESIDSPLVCEALRDAQNRGSLIIALDSLTECVRGLSSVHSVGFTGFSERAKELVAIAVAEAEKRHYSADRPIVVLENRTTYSYGKERLASLVEALKAKTLLFDIVQFDGDHDQARAAMKSYLTTNPSPRIVLAHDHEALAAGYEMTQAMQKQNNSEFVVAGYAFYDVREGFALVDNMVASIVQDANTFSDVVARSIHELAGGKTVQNRIEIGVELVQVRH